MAARYDSSARRMRDILAARHSQIRRAWSR